MNTIQIKHLLKKDPFAKTIFKKVCAKNQLLRVDYPSAYVINSHPSFKPGEHWIAMYFDKHGKGEYFDSYDLRPSMNGFTAFMERNSNGWMYNNKTVQSLISTTCGHYVCILFCIVAVVITCVILFLVSHQILLKIIATLICLFVLSR